MTYTGRLQKSKSMNGAYHDKETRVKSDDSLIINNSSNRVKEK
jgi:hypothetical protein